LFEFDWRNVFAVDAANVDGSLPKPPGECNTNCTHAREIKCVCSCGGKNHGAANRKGMEPLDKALGLDRETPTPLADLALDLELSGRLEFP